MTNEDIERKCLEYSQASTPAYTNGDFDRYAIAQAFEDGAEWRINSVWHDTKEKPAERRLCLYILKDGSYGSGYYHKNDNTIFYERFDDVDKWAYFDDLIPNQIKEYRNER